MTDRELLELAAKAAGVEGSQCEWKTALRVTRERGVAPVLWNPLTDDGDALRLAVKLMLCLDIHVEGCFVEAQEIDQWADDCGNDRYAATRRAIVRAAAEIGKAMP